MYVVFLAVTSLGNYMSHVVIYAVIEK